MYCSARYLKNLYHPYPPYAEKQKCSVVSLAHERDIRFGGEIHNNKMERMNGQIRDRERVVRSVKKPDSPLITGLQIYHNYVRPHMGLDGRTPAEAAGIEVKGANRWLTLIQNASQEKAKDSEKTVRT
jgi:hypothetical protein